VVSVLDEFFKRFKKSNALREKLRLEIRAHQGFFDKLMRMWTCYNKSVSYFCPFVDAQVTINE
jgi:hypothetical protein